MRIFALPQPWRTRRRPVLALAVAALTLGAQGAAAPAHAASLATANLVEGPPQGNVVIEWNRTLLDIVRTPHAQSATIHPTRNFAIMSAAVYDAVNAISRAHTLYGISLTAPRDASRPAAAAAAAHDTLTALYPARKTSLNQQLASDLAGIPNGRAKQEGIQVGAQAAHAILALRAHDGADATPPPPYTTTGKPGDYRPTPPAFKAPEFTHWGNVTPFLLRTGHQFRPAAPPPLASPAYAAAINEVKAIGAAHSTTRTAEQTTAAKFWATPAQYSWNDIAQQVAARYSDLDQSADLFALLNLTVADVTIGLYDAKYHYRLWRPVTAIRLAAGNPRTKRDPTWTPLVIIPPDPSYPGLSSGMSTAAAAVLASFYGDRIGFTLTSPVTPGITKTFTSFSAAATETGLSRIWAGAHTRLDHQSANELAAAVSRYALGQLKVAPATPGSPTAKTSAGSGAAAGVTVAVRDSKVGKILVDGHGRTLYLFEADKGIKSTCYRACAKAWPPLTTTGKPEAGSGVSPALLGTTARTDHTTEVTYNGHPLYFFVSDAKPGDTTGQAIDSFGAKWYVLNPKGNKIDKS
ncbi:MAG: hypothetical protein JWR24_2131 [Actinoallomurus sp.]|nr:hypothetical protein [Actinoallomurus sp.]